MVVSLRMYGEYAMQANNPEKLVLQVTGTGIQDNQSIGDWVDQQLIKSLRKFTSQPKSGQGIISVLKLSAFLPEIETQGVSAGKRTVGRIRSSVPKFGNVDVSLTDEDAAMLKNSQKIPHILNLPGLSVRTAAGKRFRCGEGMASGAGRANPACRWFRGGAEYDGRRCGRHFRSCRSCCGSADTSGTEPAILDQYTSLIACCGTAMPQLWCCCGGEVLRRMRHTGRT